MSVVVVHSLLDFILSWKQEGLLKELDTCSVLIFVNSRKLTDKNICRGFYYRLEGMIA